MRQAHEVPRQAALGATAPWLGERLVMRSAWGYGVAAILLLGGIAGGWYWWEVGRFIESTDDAFVQADISAVTTSCS